jgi:hypothetical protein
MVVSGEVIGTKVGIVSEVLRLPSAMQESPGPAQLRPSPTLNRCFISSN